MRQKQADRTERIPLGVPRLTMNIDEETKKRYADKKLRWVNDEDGRLLSAQGGGYEFVVHGRDPVKVGDLKNVKADRRVCKQVGKHRDGSPMFAYLMAIPREYYEQDQAEKEKANRMVDEAINGGKPKGLQEHGVAPEHGGSYVKNIDYRP